MLKRVLKRLASLRAAFVVLVCMALPLLGATPVEQYGQLKISGGKLCSASGTPVQLKGMSWFWSQWSTEWWNATTLNNAVDQYGITLARLAMGTPSNGVDLAAEKARVITVVEAARAKGIYVIIDWHSHAAENYTDQAKAFFVEMANRYKNVPNVMFEIYNEPLNTTSWSTIRAYAETVGWAIRSTGANNVIIVGTKTWSQDVDEASAWPVSFTNAAYTFHFYADTHRLDSGFRQKVDTALSRGCAVIVTEWGTDNNLAQGPVNETETRKWIEYMAANKISWANWSLFNKDTDGETASFFKGGTSATGPWNDANLSTSGALVKQFFSAPNPTTLSVSPATVTLSYAGGSATSALTASVGWTAVANQSWFSVTPTSGSSNATLTVTAQANTGTTARTGTITITGNEGSTTTLTVNQGVNDGNISTGKAVTASSLESAAYPAANVTDGNATTRWASAFADPQWITVDLGASYTLTKVVLSWEAAFAKSYQIQVSSDNTTFTTVYTTTSGAGGTESLNVAGTGRYVRMYGTARATVYGYSLYEFQIYGTPANTQTLSVSPASVALSSAAGTSTLAVTSNVAWTASSSQSWLTLSPASGSGNGSIVLSAAANTGASRSAVVTVAGPAGSGLVKTVAVTQSGQSTFSLKVEAESFIEKAGVQTESCSDTGGGLNVGYIDQGDWMKYSITVPSAGSYTIQYRVASPNSGKSLSSDLNAGATQLGSVAITNTGSWQTWTTVSQTVTLSAGTHAFGINAGTGGFNVNWFTVTYNGN